MPDDSRILTPQTLGDVIAELDAHPTLPARRRRDLASAVRRIAEMIGAPPSALPAVLSKLRHRLNALSAQQLGIEPKSLQNLRSSFLTALRVTGAIRIKAMPLTAAWTALRATLPNKRMRNGLSRFLTYLSDRGFEPESVGDEVSVKFLAFLESDTLVAHPHDAHRAACRIWNEAADTVPGWPAIRLRLPDYRKPRQSLPLDAFPESFRNDLTAYLRHLAEDNPFAEDRPVHVCKPNTIRLRRQQILLAASALAMRGIPSESITGLAVLTSAQHVKEILRFYYERNGKQWTTFARNLAQALLSIAKNWVKVDAATYDELLGIRRQMGSEPTGLTPKNTAMLRQFYEPANLRRLFDLPTELAIEARKNSGAPARRAVLMQLAVVIDVLLHAPIRMKNLVTIEIGRHLTRPGGLDTPFVLIFRDLETKNGLPLEYPLTAETSDLIDEYLRDYRPLFSANDSKSLFPSLADGQKDQSTLASQITKCIAERTGFRMTPHQFRHLAATVILDRHPNALHLVQQLLGHKNAKTTMRFYAGLNPRGAAQMMSQIVSDVRDNPSSPRRRR